MSKVEVTYIGAAWCKTCKTIKPQIEELCKKFSVQLNILDYDADLEVEEKEQITKVPTIRIYESAVKKAEFNMNQVEQTDLWLSGNIKITTDEDF